MKEKLIQLIHNHNIPQQGINTILDIPNYVDKLLKNATIIPIIGQEEVQAVIAFYVNDTKKENAFLSLILVSDEFQGKNIGDFLLKTSIAIIKSKDFKNYNLEVLKDNHRAINFYKKNGFEIIERENKNDLFYLMRLKL